MEAHTHLYAAKIHPFRALYASTENEVARCRVTFAGHVYLDELEEVEQDTLFWKSLKACVAYINEKTKLQTRDWLERVYANHGEWELQNLRAMRKCIC